MESRAHAIIAACFLVTFGVAIVLIFWWLSSGPGEPLAYRIVTSQSVAGLSPQSTVEFKGLEVGHVRRIRFDPDDRSRLIVDFNVRRDTYMTHATYAVLTTHGLTGAEVLELKLGPGSRAPLPTRAGHPAQIPLRKGLLAQLEDSAKQNLQTLHDVLENARDVLGEGNRRHIGATLQQLDEATAKLVAIEGDLEPAMRRMPALAKSAQQSLDASRALIANANRLAEQAREPVRKAGEAADSVQHLSRKLDTRTAPDIEALSRSLTRTSRMLEELLRELKAKPQSLIFGPPEHPPGPGEPGFRDPDRDGDGHE